MTLNAKIMTSNAAADSLEKHNEAIKSNYDINATFGPVTVDGTILPVCYPVGFNTTLGKYSPWIAPDPTVVTVNLATATSGTFTLTVNGIATAAIAYNATALAVEYALRDIGYNVSVSLASGVYTITFDEDIDIITPPVVTGVLSSNMPGDVGESAVVVEGTEVVPDPVVLTIDLGGATGGDFTITVDDVTTTAIAHNADKAAIEAALAAMTPTIVATATVGATITVSFGSYAQLVTLPVVSADLTGLTGDTNPTATVTEEGTALVPDPTVLTIDVGAATGGTFTITINSTATSALAYNVSAANLITAIGVAGAVVTATKVGTVYTVTFGNLADLVSLPTITTSLIGLTGVNITPVTGTTSYGAHKITGFVNAEPITLSDTDDVLGTVCVAGEIAYSAIEDLVAVGDVTALQAALKHNLIPGIIVQGLPGIY